MIGGIPLSPESGSIEAPPPRSSASAQVRTFHSLRRVAPLKPSWSLLSRSCSKPIPLSPESGSIEATRLSHVMSHTVIIPLSPESGSIEARTAFIRSPKAEASFHSLRRVAPLKLMVIGLLWLLIDTFHSLRRVAPLKQIEKLLLKTSKESPFHSLRRVAPLKHTPPDI